MAASRVGRTFTKLKPTTFKTYYLLQLLLTLWLIAQSATYGVKIGIMHYGSHGPLGITCNRDELILISSEVLGYSTNTECNPGPSCSVPYTLAQWYCRGRSTCSGIPVERRPLHKRTCGSDFTNCLRVEYHCVKRSSLVDICNENGVQHTVQGYITSPNFPEMYPPHKNCSCSLQSDAPLRLKTIFFLIKAGEPCNDWLRVKVNGDTMQGPQCGYVAKESVYHGNNIELQFHSDAYNQEMGFWVDYRSSSPSGLILQCSSESGSNIISGQDATTKLDLIQLHRNNIQPPPRRFLRNRGRWIRPYAKQGVDIGTGQRVFLRGKVTGISGDDGDLIEKMQEKLPVESQEKIHDVVTIMPATKQQTMGIQFSGNIPIVNKQNLGKTVAVSKSPMVVQNSYKILSETESDDIFSSLLNKGQFKENYPNKNSIDQLEHNDLVENTNVISKPGNNPILKPGIYTRRRQKNIKGLLKKMSKNDASNKIVSINNHNKTDALEKTKEPFRFNTNQEQTQLNKYDIQSTVTIMPNTNTISSKFTHPSEQYYSSMKDMTTIHKHPSEYFNSEANGDTTTHRSTWDDKISVESTSMKMDVETVTVATVFETSDNHMFTVSTEITENEESVKNDRSYHKITRDDDELKQVSYENAEERNDSQRILHESDLRFESNNELSVEEHTKSKSESNFSKLQDNDKIENIATTPLSSTTVKSIMLATKNKPSLQTKEDDLIKLKQPERKEETSTTSLIQKTQTPPTLSATTLHKTNTFNKMKNINNSIGDTYEMISSTEVQNTEETMFDRTTPVQDITVVEHNASDRLTESEVEDVNIKVSYPEMDIIKTEDMITNENHDKYFQKETMNEDGLNADKDVINANKSDTDIQHSQDQALLTNEMVTNEKIKNKQPMKHEYMRELPENVAGSEILEYNFDINEFLKPWTKMTTKYNNRKGVQQPTVLPLKHFSNSEAFSHMNASMYYLLSTLGNRLFSTKSGVKKTTALPETLSFSKTLVHKTTELPLPLTNSNIVAQKTTQLTEPLKYSKNEATKTLFSEPLVTKKTTTNPEQMSFLYSHNDSRLSNFTEHIRNNQVPRKNVTYKNIHNQNQNNSYSNVQNVETNQYNESDNNEHGQIKISTPTPALKSSIHNETIQNATKSNRLPSNTVNPDLPNTDAFKESFDSWQEKYNTWANYYYQMYLDKQKQQSNDDLTNEVVGEEELGTNDAFEEGIDSDKGSIDNGLAHITMGEAIVLDIAPNKEFSKIIDNKKVNLPDTYQSITEASVNDENLENNTLLMDLIENVLEEISHEGETDMKDIKNGMERFAKNGQDVINNEVDVIEYNIEDSDDTDKGLKQTDFDLIMNKVDKNRTGSDNITNNFIENEFDFDTTKILNYSHVKDFILSNHTKKINESFNHNDSQINNNISSHINNSWTETKVNETIEATEIFATNVTTVEEAEQVTSRQKNKTKEMKPKVQLDDPDNLYEIMDADIEEWLQLLNELDITDEFLSNNNSEYIEQKYNKDQQNSYNDGLQIIEVHNMTKSNQTNDIASLENDNYTDINSIEHLIEFDIDDFLRPNGGFSKQGPDYLTNQGKEDPSEADYAELLHNWDNSMEHNSSQPMKVTLEESEPIGPNANEYNREHWWNQYWQDKWQETWRKYHDKHRNHGDLNGTSDWFQNVHTGWEPSNEEFLQPDFDFQQPVIPPYLGEQDPDNLVDINNKDEQFARWNNVYGKWFSLGDDKQPIEEFINVIKLKWNEKHKDDDGKFKPLPVHTIPDPDITKHNMMKDPFDIYPVAKDVYYRKHGQNNPNDKYIAIGDLEENFYINNYYQNLKPDDSLREDIFMHQQFKGRDNQVLAKEMNPEIAPWDIRTRDSDEQIHLDQGIVGVRNNKFIANERDSSKDMKHVSDKYNTGNFYEGNRNNIERQDGNLYQYNKYPMASNNQKHFANNFEQNSRYDGNLYHHIPETIYEKPKPYPKLKILKQNNDKLMNTKPVQNEKPWENNYYNKEIARDNSENWENEILRKNHWPPNEIPNNWESNEILNKNDWHDNVPMIKKHWEHGKIPSQYKFENENPRPNNEITWDINKWVEGKSNTFGDEILNLDLNGFDNTASKRKHDYDLIKNKIKEQNLKDTSADKTFDNKDKVKINEPFTKAFEGDTSHMKPEPFEINTGLKIPQDKVKNVPNRQEDLLHTHAQPHIWNQNHPGSPREPKNKKADSEIHEFLEKDPWKLYESKNKLTEEKVEPDWPLNPWNDIGLARGWDIQRHPQGNKSPPRDSNVTPNTDIDHVNSQEEMVSWRSNNRTPYVQDHWGMSRNLGLYNIRGQSPKPFAKAGSEEGNETFGIWPHSTDSPEFPHRPMYGHKPSNHNNQPDIHNNQPAIHNNQPAIHNNQPGIQPIIRSNQANSKESHRHITDRQPSIHDNQGHMTRRPYHNRLPYTHGYTGKTLTPIYSEPGSKMAAMESKKEQAKGADKDTVWVLLVLAIIGWLIFMVMVGLLIYYKRERMCHKRMLHRHGYTSSYTSSIPKHLLFPDLHSPLCALSHPGADQSPSIPSRSPSAKSNDSLLGLSKQIKARKTNKQSKMTTKPQMHVLTLSDNESISNNSGFSNGALSERPLPMIPLSLGTPLGFAHSNPSKSSTGGGDLMAFGSNSSTESIGVQEIIGNKNIPTIDSKSITSGGTTRSAITTKSAKSQYQSLNTIRDRKARSRSCSNIKQVKEILPSTGFNPAEVRARVAKKVENSGHIINKADTPGLSKNSNMKFSTFMPLEIHNTEVGSTESEQSHSSLAVITKNKSQAMLEELPQRDSIPSVNQSFSSPQMGHLSTPYYPHPPSHFLQPSVNETTVPHQYPQTTTPFTSRKSSPSNSEVNHPSTPSDNKSTQSSQLYTPSERRQGGKGSYHSESPFDVNSQKSYNPSLNSDNSKHEVYHLDRAGNDGGFYSYEQDIQHNNPQSDQSDVWKNSEFTTNNRVQRYEDDTDRPSTSKLQTSSHAPVKPNRTHLNSEHANDSTDAIYMSLTKIARKYNTDHTESQEAAPQTVWTEDDEMMVLPPPLDEDHSNSKPMETNVYQNGYMANQQYNKTTEDVIEGGGDTDADITPGDFNPLTVSGFYNNSMRRKIKSPSNDQVYLVSPNLINTEPQVKEEADPEGSDVADGSEWEGSQHQEHGEKMTAARSMYNSKPPLGIPGVHYMRGEDALGDLANRTHINATAKRIITTLARTKPGSSAERIKKIIPEQATVFNEKVKPELNRILSQRHERSPVQV